MYIQCKCQNTLPIHFTDLQGQGQSLVRFTTILLGIGTLRRKATNFEVKQISFKILYFVHLLNAIKSPKLIEVLEKHCRCVRLNKPRVVQFCIPPGQIKEAATKMRLREGSLILLCCDDYQVMNIVIIFEDLQTFLHLSSRQSDRNESYRLLIFKIS